jgi:hypothetical protein
MSGVEGGKSGKDAEGHDDAAGKMALDGDFDDGQPFQPSTPPRETVPACHRSLPAMSRGRNKSYSSAATPVATAGGDFGAE